MATLRDGVRLSMALSLSVVACGVSPAYPEPQNEEAPTIKLVMRCTRYAECLRSFEAAQAYSARCGGCAEGQSAVASVRLRLDALYLEENREAIEQEARDRSPRPVPVAVSLRSFVDTGAAERARQQVVLTGRAECVATADMARCDASVATDEERAACRSDCEALGRNVGADLVRQALRSCVKAETKVSCGEASPWTLPGAMEGCVRRCDDLRKEWRRFNATHAMCCDGSRSPSCTNEDFGRGCCSHHGGGCLEDPPPVE